MSNNHTEWEEEFSFESRKSDNKEILRFIGRIIRNWYWFVICGFLGFLGAFLYLRYSISVYKIHAKLLISDYSKGGGMLSSSALGDLSGFVGGKSSVDNEVEILRTADLMRKMVLAKKAYISYFNKGRVHEMPVPSAPLRVELLKNLDSFTRAYALGVQFISEVKLRLSAPDT